MNWFQYLRFDLYVVDAQPQYVMFNNMFAARFAGAPKQSDDIGLNEKRI